MFASPPAKSPPSEEAFDSLPESLVSGPVDDGVTGTVEDTLPLRKGGGPKADGLALHGLHDLTDNVRGPAEHKCADEHCHGDGGLALPHEDSGHLPSIA